MAKLMMLAGGIVKAKEGVRALSAYVVLSAGHKSRIFKIRGAPDAPEVTELAAATTIDLKRFQRDLLEDLQPALKEAARPSIDPAPGGWVCGMVRDHLKTTEGMDVEV
jgi:hypothetical protein